jgi:magnesium transporter
MTDERISDARALIRHLRVRGRLVRRGGKEAGSDPGTLVHTGRQRVENVRYWLFEYDKDTVEERRPDSVPNCFPFAGPNLTTWLNVDGLHEVNQLRDLGERAHLHPLVTEDVVSIGQRPKVENYDHQLYIVLRALEYDDRNDEIAEDQISIVLGQDFVLSFQEQPGDSFDPIRDRLRTGKGTLRERGADFLAYSLIDAVVDDYFGVLEKVGDRLEDLESEVMTAPTRETINRVHHLKRELIVMRKAVWPLRDVLNSLVRDETALITPQTRIFLRDAYDHAVQVIDTVETMRDLVSGLVDLYLSAISNRANEVMKVLTIIATIFIPLTFVVGIYGMNFDYMPELRWRWGYPVVMLLMAIVAGGMLVFFRRKRWI